MFKTDPHVHTSDVSLCAHLRSDLMAEAYKEAGYKTIIITEHLAHLFCSFLDNNSSSGVLAKVLNALKVSIVQIKTKIVLFIFLLPFLLNIF